MGKRARRGKVEQVFFWFYKDCMLLVLVKPRRFLPFLTFCCAVFTFSSIGCDAIDFQASRWYGRMKGGITGRICGTLSDQIRQNRTTYLPIDFSAGKAFPSGVSTLTLFLISETERLTNWRSSKSTLQSLLADDTFHWHLPQNDHLDAWPQFWLILVRVLCRKIRWVIWVYKGHVSVSQHHNDSSRFRFWGCEQTYVDDVAQPQESAFSI